MEEKICQSCDMNIKTAEVFESNADGTKNMEYCHYCYQNGAFTRNVRGWMKCFPTNHVPYLSI